MPGRRQGLIAMALVIAVLVGFSVYAVYGTPASPSLWIVADRTDPLPDTPYTLRSLEAASSRPLLGSDMDVTEPAEFADRMAADDGAIATLVLHIDVLDDVSADLVRHHFERGVQVVLIGGGMHRLVAWLGSHLDANETSMEASLQGQVERPDRAAHWPAARKVSAAGCGASSGAHALRGGEVWMPERAIFARIITNPCNERRQAFLQQLAAGPTELEVGDEPVWIGRWQVGDFLRVMSPGRDPELVTLTRAGEAFELTQHIRELKWTQASITYPLMITDGTYGPQNSHVVDLEQARLVLTYEALLAPLGRQWEAIGGAELLAFAVDGDETPPGHEPGMAHISDAAYGPAGRILAFITRHCRPSNRCYGTSGVLTAETGELTFIRAVDGSPRLLTWSPDGAHVAYTALFRHEERAASEAIYVDSVTAAQGIATTGRLSLREEITDQARVMRLAWSQDGRQLQLTIRDLDSEDEVLWLFELESGQLQPVE